MNDPIDIAAQIARIDGNIAETQKLFKAGRGDTWFLIVGAVGAAITMRLPELLGAFGLHGGG